VAQVRIPGPVVAFLHEARWVLRDPLLVVWSLFVFLIPFYVFSSGVPQPGDILVIPLVLLTFRSWNGRLDRRARRPVVTLAAFTLWIVIVDWGWALVLGNFGLLGPNTFLLFPIYYVYNGLVFVAVCVLYQRYGKRLLSLTLNLVFLTVFVQTAAALLAYRGGGGGHRGVGFFNNPNQLGFFVLVAASIIALGKGRLGFGSIKSGLGLTLCLYLALLSASRAAVIGSGLLFALTVISSPKRLVVVVLVVVPLLAIGGPFSDALDRTQARLAEQRYPQLNFFQQRGYDRILANKEYWLLGAGEGGTSRFVETTAIGATEIHSSIGTIFFSYGIVGISLFLVFLYRVVERGALRTTIILLPALSYTIAHQGLRATLVWILFALIVCIKLMPRTDPVPAAPAAKPRASLP